MSQSAITLCRWGNPNERAFAGPVFVMDGERLPADLTHASVAVPAGGATRARELLARGARQVLMGEAALLDSSLIEALIKDFGKDRIGLWVPVRRMARNWALDQYSNEDFSCVTPSCGAPAWEVLKCDGTGSGTDALWWIGQMVERGASCALVAADIEDDDDLNICADMVERFGSALWLAAPAHATALDDMVRFGQARKLVIPHLQQDDPVAMRALRRHLEASIEAVA